MVTAYDWLIVGGGVHGVHLAARLIGEAGVPPDRLAIVDPAPTLLDRWTTLTARTGMTHLRSPGVHHLDLEPWSLVQFAERTGWSTRPRSFAKPYGRPSRSLFTEHCAHVIQRFTLDERHIQDRVARLDLQDREAVVTLDSGEVVDTRHVLLAIGSTDTAWPAWARDAALRGARIRHVFDPHDAEDGARVAVIGGGITAAQVALRLQASDHDVRLVARHPFRKHDFDSDPGWIGPKHMRGFLRTSSLDRRRDIIRAARHRGSIPPDVHRTVRKALVGGAIQRIEGDVIHATTEDGLRLHVGNQVVDVDSVVLATGFRSERPGGALVDALVEAHGLACGTCGYPVVDSQLRWHPSLFVSGGLAELEIGPVARNIAGARRAAERIVSVASAGS